MHNIHINAELLFVLVRDARLDGYRNVSKYLKEQYDAELIDDLNELIFNNTNKQLLFELTYSGYI